MSNNTVKKRHLYRGNFIFVIISFLKGESVDYFEHRVAPARWGVQFFFDSTTFIMNIIPLDITPAPYITVYCNQ